MSEYVPCCVVDGNTCDAPANYEGTPAESAHCTCFACGEAVCKSCSMRVKYYTFGYKRLCHNCLASYDGNEKRVLAHMTRVANAR